MEDSAKTVAVGMSGGVDSAMACVLLQRSGYQVYGVTCLFTHDDASTDAARDAKKVADHLGIAHTVRDCTESFESCVVQPFVDCYARGYTPSPCVHCNAVCKLPQLAAAADNLGCTYIATGHYARITQMQDTGRFVVKRALDDTKDQSYMLSLVEQDLLGRLVTPLGGMTKAMVRIEALDLGLPVASRPDSQDICFVDSGDYRMFLEERGVKGAPGDIVTTEGTVVGRHTGLQDYTIGQRKGLGIGGVPEPYFVVQKVSQNNTLVVAFKQDALINSVVVTHMTWQAFVPQEPLMCSVKLHYRAAPVAAKVCLRDDGHTLIELMTPQPATSPGQCAVLFIGDTVIAGGTIDSIQLV